MQLSTDLTTISLEITKHTGTKLEATNFCQNNRPQSNDLKFYQLSILILETYLSSESVQHLCYRLRLRKIKILYNIRCRLRRHVANYKGFIQRLNVKIYA